MGFFNTLDKDIYAQTKERTGVRWTGSLANFKDLHGPLPFSGPQFPCMKMRRGEHKTNSFPGSRQQYCITITKRAKRLDNYSSH